MDDLIQLPVSIKTMVINKERIKVYFPRVKGLKNQQAELLINNTILKEVYRLISEAGYYENPNTDITGYYEIKTNQRGILSISLIHYFFSGGAHGMTISRSYTFNTKTGKLYQLKDLFKANSDYVKVISDNVKKQIADREITLIEEFKQIKPDQDFYIADKCLVIYFQLYEITAYVYGFPYFPMSVYYLQDIIDEEGPLGRMIS